MANTRVGGAISAEAVWTRTGKNGQAHWPKPIDGQVRLGTASMPVYRPDFELHPGAKIFTIGSCFAREIEVACGRYGYEVPTLSYRVPESEWRALGSPNGILNKYVPHSVLNELRFALPGHDGIDPDAFFVEDESGGYHDVQTPFPNAISLERARERRTEFRDLFAQAYDSDVVIITLGLLEAWLDSKTSLYLNQTPPIDGYVKHHPGRFYFEVLSFDRAAAATRKAISLLLSHGRRNVRVLLTTSPVPLARTFREVDVFTANCHSKSVLRAVAGEMELEFPEVQYFPSYECATLSKREAVWSFDHRHLHAHFIDHMMRVSFFATFGVEERASLEPTPAAALARLFASGQFVDVIEQVERNRLLEGVPIDSEPGRSIATLYARSLLRGGDVAAATQLLHQLLTIGDDVTVRADLVVGLLQLKQYDRASAHVHRLGKALPDTPWVAYLRGRVAVARGKFGHVRPILEKLAQTTPELAVRLEAWMLFCQEKHDQLVQVLDRCEAAGPDPECLKIRALLLQRTGHDREFDRSKRISGPAA